MRQIICRGVAPALAFAMIAAIGCNDSNSTTGGSATSPSPQASVPPAGTGGTPPKPPPPDVKAAAGTASVMGRVSFNGDPPKRREINFGPEKKCHDHHTTPPTDDSVVVSADRSVQWVLVRIVGKVPGNFPTPEKPAVLDQKGCIFTPHILAVQVGQEIDIKNSDEVLHNVRCEATVNPPFNRNLPKVGDVMKVKFDVPEVGLKIKCDVHFWMGAYIHVMPHPFFALTGENGRFVIEKLPPGTYKLEAWHEKFGKQTKDITVKDGEVFTADFEFQPK